MTSEDPVSDRTSLTGWEKRQLHRHPSICWLFAYTDWSITAGYGIAYRSVVGQDALIGESPSGGIIGRM